MFRRRTLERLWWNHCNYSVWYIFKFIIFGVLPIVFCFVDHLWQGVHTGSTSGITEISARGNGVWDEQNYYDCFKDALPLIYYYVDRIYNFSINHQNWPDVRINKIFEFQYDPNVLASDYTTANWSELAWFVTFNFGDFDVHYLDAVWTIWSSSTIGFDLVCIQCQTELVQFDKILHLLKSEMKSTNFFFIKFGKRVAKLDRIQKWMKISKDILIVFSWTRGML